MLEYKGLKQSIITSRCGNDNATINKKYSGDVRIMEEMDYYVLFPNVNEALMLEKKLKENNIKYTIVPTPRELSKCCGISVKYLSEDEESIKKIVEDNSIKVVGFHQLPRRKTPSRTV